MLTEQELADFGKMAESTIKEGKEHVSGFWQDMTAEELARHPAFKKAVAIQRLLAELDALRKRNEKLEEAMITIRNMAYGELEREGIEPCDCSAVKACNESIGIAESALSALDKEDA